jgi:hypothetical protein
VGVPLPEAHLEALPARVTHSPILSIAAATAADDHGVGPCAAELSLKSRLVTEQL